MQVTIEEALRQGVEAHRAGHLDIAESRYRTILQAEPNHPDANHNLGVFLVGASKTDQALQYFKIAIEGNPKVEQYWLSYIGALVRGNQRETAIQIIEAAREHSVSKDKLDTFASNLAAANGKGNKVNSRPPDKLLNNLLQVYQTGEYAASEKLAIAMTEKFPEHPFGWKILASLLKRAGKFAEALTVSENLTELVPLDAEAHNNLGNILRESGRVQDALKAYGKAISLRPNYAEAHFNLAITQHEMGKTDDAKIGYRRAISIKPAYAEAYSNLGIILYGEEKFNEAKKSLTQAISLSPNSPQFNNNLGATLLALGKYSEAGIAFATAVELAPDFPEAHCNLGTSFQKLGKLEEAVGSYRQAISISQDYTEAHGNLGIVYHELGDSINAEASYRRAIELDPDSSQAHTNLGITLYERGEVISAIEEHVLSIKLARQDTNAYFNLALALENIQIKTEIPELAECITKILQKRTLVNPVHIATATISLLKQTSSIKNVLDLHSKDKMSSSLLQIIEALSRESALLEIIKASPLPDAQFEKLFKDIRAEILTGSIDLYKKKNFSTFQVALALHCNTNEYLYDQTEEETEFLNRLEASVEKKISRGKQPDPQELLCLASYKVLNEYSWISKITFPTRLKELQIRQVTEPQIEEQLKNKIKRHTIITDNTSRIVGQQYEKRPYPRYTSLRLSSSALNITQVVQVAKLKLSDSKITTVESPEVLIAGCGTGSHSISSAARYARSKILAIDLSLSSLAFAQRKTHEFGLSNIEYLQADILDLGSLHRKFDIIESGGVLHHMKDPMAGWKQLVTKLKPGGLMKIGLYSELARQHIVKIRAEIKLNKIGTSDAEIRKFRQKLIESNEEHHKKLIKSLDFYSLSETRDLIFHEQEHRFSIQQIQKSLTHLDLNFCGFESTKIVALFDSKFEEKDSRYDLAKWMSFEVENPHAFSSMYQFWCQKK